MERSALVARTGQALAAGGIVVALLNLVLTPRVISTAPFEESAATSLYVWRQSLSALSAALLMFGSIGLYLSTTSRRKVFGAVAFVAAIGGSALLLAWEWVSVFVLHDLAVRAPAALTTLENTPGLNLYDLGAIIPISLFSIGWIALATWSSMASHSFRLPAIIAGAGLFATPVLAGMIGPGWGTALGNAVFGAGLFLLGLRVHASAHTP